MIRVSVAQPVIDSDPLVVGIQIKCQEFLIQRQAFAAGPDISAAAVRGFIHAVVGEGGQGCDAEQGQGEQAGYWLLLIGGYLIDDILA